MYAIAYHIICRVPSGHTVKDRLENADIASLTAILKEFKMLRGSSNSRMEVSNLFRKKSQL